LVVTLVPDEVLDRIRQIPARYAPPPDSRGTDNEQALAEIIDEMDGKITPKITIGIGNLDAKLGGFGPGTLTVVGAATSCGKSVLLGQAAIHVATRKNKVALFFALEMTTKEMYQRWARYLSEQRDGGNRKKIIEALAELRLQTEKNGMLHVFDGPRNVQAIERACEVYVETMDVGIVCVDYLQLVLPNPKITNRQEQIADITRSLKQIAGKFKVPIITGSQLNRQGEEKPTLRSLRESGAIGQDADIVLLLTPKQSRSHTVEMMIRIAKNRNGKTGAVDLAWDKAIHRIRDVVDTDGFRPSNYEQAFDEWAP